MGIIPIIPLIWFVFISSANSLQFRDNPLNSVDSSIKPYERHLIRRAAKDVPLNSTDSSIKEFHHNLTRPATKEELSKSVNQMHMISRIINGIYLQQSLAKKAIPSEELISELLNIGSLTTAQIVGIKGAELTTVVDQINQLSTKLSATNDIKAVETQIFLSASIANEVKGLDGKFSISVDHKYLKAVNHLAKKYEGLKVNKLIKTLIGFLERMHFLDAYNDDEVKARQAFSDIDAFVKYVQKLNGTSTTSTQSVIATELKEISKSDTLKSFESSFPFLLPLSDAVTKYKNNAAVLAKDNNKLITTFAENIKSMGLVSKTLEEILPNLEYLRKAIVLRHQKHGNSVFKHIPGLINGISDINLINDDLGKDWVKQVVMGQAPNIFDSLTLLGDLDKFSRLVVTSFGLDPGDMFKEISKISELARKLTKLSTSPLAEKADKIKINVSAVNASSLQLFGTLIANMKSLSVKLNSLGKVVKIIKTLNNPENKAKMDRILEIAKNSDDDQIPSTLAAFQNSTDFEPIREIVQSVNSSFEALLESKTQNTTEIAKSVSDTLKNSAVMEDVTKFFNAINPLNNMQEIKHVKPVIEAIQHLRESTKVPLSISSTVGNLPKMKKELKDLKNFIEGKKIKSKRAAVNVMDQLKNASSQLSVIGSATRGIFSMNEALNMKLDMADLKSLCAIVQLEMSKVTTLDTKDQQNLQRLATLGAELETMTTSLNKFMGTVKVSNSPKLVDHSGVFEAASKVQGVKGDFMAIKQSVIKLIEESKIKTLDGLLKMLDTLDTVGLDFASHASAFAGSKKSLQALDTSFASLNKTSIASSNASGSGGTPESSGFWDSWTSWLYISLAILVPVLGGIVIVLVVLKYVEKRNQKKVDEHQRRNEELKIELDKKHAKEVDQMKIVKHKKQEQVLFAQIKYGALAEKKPIDYQAHVDDNANAYKPMNPIEMDVTPTKYTKKSSNGFIEKVVKDIAEYPKPVDPPKNSWERFSEYIKGQVLWCCQETVTIITDWVKSHVKDQRFTVSMFANSQNALVGYGKRFVDGYIHASRVTFPNNLRMILTQSPQHKTDTRNSTTEKFWWMAMQERSKSIVQLCENMEPTHNLDWNTSEACSEYVPMEKGDEIKFDGGSVRCVQKSMEFGDEVEVRQLVVKFDDQPEFAIEHLWYRGWKDRLVPDSPKIMLDLLDKVNTNTTPVIVHCKNGISKSACFAYIELACQMIPGLTSDQSDRDILYVLLRMRAECFPNYQLYSFALYGVFMRLMEKGKATCKKDYDYYCNIYNDWYSATNNARIEHIARRDGRRIRDKKPEKSLHPYDENGKPNRSILVDPKLGLVD